MSLALMTKITDKMTTDSTSECTFDSYKVRMEALIESKMKEEIAQVKRWAK